MPNDRNPRRNTKFPKGKPTRRGSRKPTPGKTPGGQMPTTTPSNKPLLIWIVVLGLVFLIFQFRGLQDRGKTLTYTEFKHAVTSNQVQTFNLMEGGVSADGALTDGTKYKVNILPQDTDLPKDLEQHGVNIRVTRTATFWSNLLYSILPMLLFIFLLWFLMYRQMRGMGRGVFSFGKSRAKLFKKDGEKTTFKDVAGLQEAKEEVAEVI